MSLVDEDDPRSEDDGEELKELISLYWPQIESNSEDQQPPQLVIFYRLAGKIWSDSRRTGIGPESAGKRLRGASLSGRRP